MGWGGLGNSPGGQHSPEDVCSHRTERAPGPQEAVSRCHGGQRRRRRRRGRRAGLMVKLHALQSAARGESQSCRLPWPPASQPLAHPALRWCFYPLLSVPLASVWSQHPPCRSPRVRPSFSCLPGATRMPERCCSCSGGLAGPSLKGGQGPGETWAVTAWLRDLLVVFQFWAENWERGQWLGRACK